MGTEAHGLFASRSRHGDEGTLKEETAGTSEERWDKDEVKNEGEETVGEPRRTGIKQSPQRGGDEEEIRSEYRVDFWSLGK